MILAMACELSSPVKALSYLIIVHSVQSNYRLFYVSLLNLAV